MKDFLSIGSGRDYKHLRSGDVPVYGTGGLLTMVDDFLYEGETVCIGRKGTIDKPLFHTGKIWTVDTLFYTHSFKNIYPHFVYLLFQRVNWKQHNEAGGVPSLAKSTIENIQFNIPSLEEQKKVSRFFSVIDKKLDSLKKKKELLEQYKKGVMQKIFSQEIRFKDDEGKDFPEWEEKELGEIATITIGEFVIKTKQNENGKYPVYNGGRSYTGLYDQFNNEGEKIVISARGANAGFVNYVKNRYWAGNSCYSIGILNNEKHNTIFVFYYLKFQEKSFIQNQQAANIPSVSKQETQRFTVKTPIIFEQLKIADFLTALDDKIDLVEQQVNNTELWKKGLLQQMFV